MPRLKPLECSEKCVEAEMIDIGMPFEMEPIMCERFSDHIDLVHLRCIVRLLDIVGFSKS